MPEDSSAMRATLQRFDESMRLVTAGYLWKRSRGCGEMGAPGANRRWARRWFVLRADSCLYFFKTEHVNN